MPETSEYFKTSGAGFINDSKSMNMKFAVTLTARKPVNGSQNWFARVSFENPVDVNSPFVELKEYDASQSEFSLHSPTMNTVKNHHTYKVTFEAFSDPARTILISTHDVFVRLDVPDGLRPQLGVKFM